ncbi:MAG: tetratricopeptide repeat protein [Verrucomicrobiota bacterium JB022]|nr:tetratricopeptide repeat protein [Verrucomicrobiota bacterium JB022]
MKIVFTLLLALAGVCPLLAKDLPTWEQLHPVLNSPQWREAEPAVQELAEQQDAEACYWLALMALARGDGEAAVDNAKLATELDASKAQYFATLGYAYVERVDEVGMMQKMGVARGLQAAFQQTLALDPKNQDALRGLQQFYLLAPGIAGGSKDKAASTMERLQELDPLEAKLMSGLTAIEQKRFDEARQNLDEVIAASPDNPLALYQSGRLSALSGQELDKGRQHLEHYLGLQLPIALMMPSEGAAHWRLGQILSALDQHEAARASLVQARELEPALSDSVERELKKLRG